jgi:hypothetical protein
MGVELGKHLWLSGDFERVVSQHDGLRFYFEAAMLGKNVELMDPVAIGVPIGSPA